jgi:hypothetical protein
MSDSPKKSAFWPAVITSVAICALMMVVGAVISLARGRAERASLIADFQSGKLSTPEAFQARCGNALSVHTTGDETTLSYSYHDLLVKLRPGAPVRFFLNRAVKSNGEFHRVEVVVSEDFGLDHLDCK